MIDVPVPVPPAPRPVERRLPPAVAPHPVAPAPVAPVRAMAPRAAPVVPHVPRVSPPPRYAAPVAPEELAKAVTAVTAKPKKKKPKTSKTTEEERLSFARPVRSEGLATLTGEAWPPILPREEVEGHDVPIRGDQRRADKVEVSSDEETAPALTRANVARPSTAAAVAAGVVEPPDVDPELRSISPISTPGVFPWQAEKKTSKKKRAESPQSTWLAI